MNEKLSDLITAENLLSYADGVINLYNTTLDLQKLNYNNFVIPSRGAFPFYYYTTHVHHLFSTDFLSIHQYNTSRKVLFLPFTSDWGDAKLEITSGQSRKFWTKVLDDLISKRDTPYTKFYKLIVESIGPRYTVNTDELLPNERFIKNKTDGFVFLNTVVSGRAICEIIAAFHEFNIKNYFFILIMDENGEMLDPVYKEIILTEFANDRAKLIYVKKIFSEDASPMLNMGICSMVFPSLMEQAIQTVQEFKRENFVGAGLWFNNSVRHIYGSRLNAVRGTLFDSICRGIRYHLVDAREHFDEMINENAGLMIKSADNFNLFDQDYTLQLVRNRIKKEVKLHDLISVSSSHVLRSSVEENFLKELNRKYRGF